MSTDDPTVVMTIHHYYEDADYKLLEDRTVRVQADDGRVGIFGIDGSWISGGLRCCDPMMARCVYDVSRVRGSMGTAFAEQG